MYQFKNWKLICEEKDREIARLKEELERVKRVERLTEKDGKWIGCKLPDGEKCPPYELCECEHFHKMRNKLAEYEDLEEQGLLLKLPARDVFESSGDTVYYIYDYEIVECINCGILLDCEGSMWIALACDEHIFQYRNMIAGIDTDPTDCCTNSTDVRIDEWGKTVFLTKAEAEKALEEMEK